MQEFLSQLSLVQWLVFAFCAILLGVAKTGFQSIVPLTVPLLALVFDAKYSIGLALPVMIVADLLACFWYRKEIHWNYLLRLIPWTFIGIVIAAWVGNIVPHDYFKTFVGIIVLLGLVLMIWNDYFIKKDSDVPHGNLFVVSFGILSGFASMIGNVGGPIVSVFLLTISLPKNHFVGTAAWVFLIMNISKIPMHLYVWDTISLQSLTYDLMVVPFVFIGAYLGIHLVRKISDKYFRVFVIVTTFGSTLALLL